MKAIIYEASTGKKWKARNLGGTILDEGSGYGALSFYLGPIGEEATKFDRAAGIALVDPSRDPGKRVLQFLSWREQFTAQDSWANGLTSTDIGTKSPETKPPPYETV